MEAERHAFIPVPVWDQPEDVTLLTSLKLLSLRKKACIHKKRLEEVQATLDVEQIEREVDALHAKAKDFRMTRIHKSEEAADALRRENLRMVSKLHMVIRDAEVRHKQLSTLSQPSSTMQASSLNSSVRKQRFLQISRENADLLDRLRKAGPTVATADELTERYNVHNELLARRRRFRRRNVARMLVPPVTKGRPEAARPQLGMPHYMRPTKPVAPLPPLQEEAHKRSASKRTGAAFSPAHADDGDPRQGKEAPRQAVAIEDAPEATRQGAETPADLAPPEPQGAVVREPAETATATTRQPDGQAREDVVPPNRPNNQETKGVVAAEVDAPGVAREDTQDYSEDFDQSDAQALLSDEAKSGVVHQSDSKAKAEEARSQPGLPMGPGASEGDLSRDALAKSVHEYTDDDFEASDSEEAQDDASKASMVAQPRDKQLEAPESSEPPAVRRTVEVERYGDEDDYEEDSESDSSEESMSRSPSEADSESAAWSSQA